MTKETDNSIRWMAGIIAILIIGVGFSIGMSIGMYISIANRFPKEGVKMDNENAKAVNCPSCQGPAIQTGNEITCEKCDATFVVVKKEGAKVKQIGPIADHEQRIQALEKLSAPKEGPPKIEQEPKPETDEEL